MRISDWSSDVCSSDLVGDHREAEVEDPDGFRGIGDIGVPSILRAPLVRELLGIVAGEVVFLVLGFLEAAAAAEEMLSPFRDVDLVDPRLLLALRHDLVREFLDDAAERDDRKSTRLKSSH